MPPAPLPSAPSSNRGPTLVLNILRIVGAVFVLLLFAGVHWLGLLYNALFLLVILAVPGVLVQKIWSGFRHRLVYAFARYPLRRENRRYAAQWLNRSLFWLLTAVVLELCIVPIQFEPADYHTIRWMFLGAVGVLIVLELFPRRRIALPVNVLFAVGWLFLAVQLVRIHLPVSPERCVVLDAPFAGEWYVFQGGRSALVNHHYLHRQQRHALDLCKTANGHTWQGNQSALESYAAFGADLFAPADGEVVDVIDDQPDQPIGGSDWHNPAGNRVVIRIAPDRYILLAHLMQGEVYVAKGDSVTRGQRIARCGNSGNTSEPHLHLQVQTHARFEAAELRTIPIRFRDVTRVRDGKARRLPDAEVRRNDRITPGDAPMPAPTPRLHH